MASDFSTGFEKRLAAAIQQLGYSFSCEWHEAAPGIKTRFVCARPLPPADPRRTVLLVHSTGFDALFPHAALIKTLCAEGYAVVSFDLPGHGRDGTGQLDPANVFAAVDGALRIFLTRFKAERGAVRPLAVGFSLGGALILRALAHRYAQDFAGAAIVATPLALPTSGALVSELRTLVQKAWIEGLADYSPWELLPSMGCFKRRIYPVRVAEGLPVTGYIRIVGDVLEAAGRYLEESGPVDTPCLFLYSDGDRVAPEAHGLLLGRKFPNHSFVTLRGLTHYSLLLSRLATASVCQWLNSRMEEEKSPALFK